MGKCVVSETLPAGAGRGRIAAADARMVSVDSRVGAFGRAVRAVAALGIRGDPARLDGNCSTFLRGEHGSARLFFACRAQVPPADGRFAPGAALGASVGSFVPRADTLETPWTAGLGHTCPESVPAMWRALAGS